MARFPRLPRIRSTAPLALVLAAAALTSACGDSNPTGASATADVKVMTQNLYLGGDIFKLTEATSPTQVPALAAQIFATVKANDFPARAGALAAEIAAANPDLIGLQEVETFRIQDPSDYVTGTTGPNATTVYLDFLAVLMDSLTARGLNYQVASEVENADVELPAAKSATEFFDIRMTDHDVILARSDVQTSNPGSAQYQTRVPFELAPGDTVWFQRGYAWVDARLEDVDFTFASTHLEVSAGGQLTLVQQAQAAELMQHFSGQSPLIVVGDFNSAPGTAPYNDLTGMFTDAWTASGSSGAGLTCCQPELLSQSQSLYERIDLVLFTAGVDAVAVHVVGNQATDKTASGLWPSDHAGVVAELQVND